MLETLDIGYAHCVIPQHAAEVFLAVAERLGFRLSQSRPFTETTAGKNARSEVCITTHTLTQLVLTGDIEQLQHFLHWWDTQLRTRNTGFITRKPID